MTVTTGAPGGPGPPGIGVDVGDDDADDLVGPAALHPALARWRRHPGDMARLVGACAVLLVLLGFAVANPDAVRQVSADLARAARRTPAPLREGLLGLAQVGALAVPVVVCAWFLWQRRAIQLGQALLAAAGAAALMAQLQERLDETVPPAVRRGAEEIESWLTGAAFPSGAYLAGLAAAVTVLTVTATRSTRRWAWTAVGAAAFARVATSVAVPVNIAVTISVGAVVGSAALLALGAPVHRAGSSAVAATLRRLGMPDGEVRRVATGAAHARLYCHEAGDVRSHVTVVGRDERNAELFLRISRALRVRGLDDERPGWSPERVVEHEALALALAAGAGARVPELLAVGATSDGEGVLAVAEVDGRPLSTLAPDEITDRTLHDVWAQVDALHRRRLAHRACEPSRVVIRPDGRAVLVDLRWTNLGADDQLIAADVASLLAGTALLVGADRAIAAARDVVPHQRLVDALPLLQPLALSPDLQGELRRHPGAIDELRAALQEELGEASYELARLERITRGHLAGIAGLTLLLYVALSFTSDLDAIGSALAEARWTELPFMLAVVAAGYVASALSLFGAVRQRLPLVETTQVMVAQTLLNRFTPANAGGMALRVRYLQKRGVDLPGAAASLGLTSGAMGVSHVVILAAFAAWGGSTGDLGFALPDVDTLVLVMVGGLVVAGAVLLTPWGRRITFGPIRTTAARVIGELAALARRPAKLALLLGGASAAKLFSVIAFVLACRSFGIGEPFAQLGLLYMTASTVASAAPTPGGVGAVEAALVAVLTGIGVPPPTALSAVLVFRVVTFWLPVLPSWFALNRLQGRDAV